MQYYKSTITGKILTQHDLDIFDDIYGENSAWNAIGTGSIEKIDPPSVIDCIKNSSSEVVAVRRYREINNCKLADAVEAVREIKTRMRHEAE